MSEFRETKQVIVIRRDLKMRRGKEIAQGAHASQGWLLSSLRPDFEVYFSPAELEWIRTGSRKIVVTVQTLEELMALQDAAHKASVRVTVITDRGDTEFNGVPTVTAVALGPDWADRIDPVTEHLPLY